MQAHRRVTRTGVRAAGVPTSLLERVIFCATGTAWQGIDQIHKGSQDEVDNLRGPHLHMPNVTFGSGGRTGGDTNSHRQGVRCTEQMPCSHLRAC